MTKKELRKVKVGTDVYHPISEGLINKYKVLLLTDEEIVFYDEDLKAIRSFIYKKLFLTKEDALKNFYKEELTYILDDIKKLENMHEEIERNLTRRYIDAEEVENKLDDLYDYKLNNLDFDGD